MFNKNHYFTCVVTSSLLIGTANLYGAAAPLPAEAVEGQASVAAAFPPPSRFFAINEMRNVPEREKIEKDANAVIKMINIVKKEDDLVKIILKLEAAALIGHIPSMLGLGKVYEKLENHSYAYSFHLLALEEYWLREEVPQALRAVSLWERLLSRLDAGASESLKQTPGKIPARYPQMGDEKKRVAIQQLIANKFEQSPYLTPEDHELRQLRFEVMDAYLQYPAFPNIWGGVGARYSEKAENQGPAQAQSSCKLAVHAFKQDGNPQALQDAALLFHKYKLPGWQDATVLLYQQANTPQGWCNLGRFFEVGELGPPDFPRAEECYMKSQLPNAYRAIGNLYCRGYLGAAPDFLKAVENWKRAGTITDWDNVAALLVDGKLGVCDFKELTTCHEQIIKLETANDRDISYKANAFLRLGISHEEGKLGAFNFKQAASYYEEVIKLKAQSMNNVNYEAEALFKLGVLHEEGKLEGTPNLPRAIECFLQAKTPSAFCRLGTLHHKANPKEALDYFEMSEAARAKINFLFVCNKLANNPTLYPVEFSTLEGRKAKAKFNFHALLAQENETEKNRLLGDYYVVEEEFLTAHHHLQKAAEKGDKEAGEYCAEIQLHLMKQEELKARKFAALSVKDSSAQETETELQEIKTDSQDNIDADLSSSDSEEDEEQEQESRAAAATSDFVRKPQKSKSNIQKIAKLEHQIENNIKKFQGMSLLFKADRDVGPKSTGPLELRFVNKGVQTDYEGWQAQIPDKIQEMMAAIHANPWGVEGIGNPERLKHYGFPCFSRQLDGSNRVVYAIKGDKILVLESSGHYEADGKKLKRLLKFFINS